MARYIDADAMLKYLEETNEADEWIASQYNADWIYSFIEIQPSADVVEVVRCKDCKHKVVTDNGKCNPHNIVCNFHESDGFDENDFCSYGEKALKERRKK